MSRKEGEVKRFERGEGLRKVVKEVPKKKKRKFEKNDLKTC